MGWQPALLALWILVAAGVAACHPPARTETGSGSRCDQEGPGTLRVANSSGRILDVYVARPAALPQMMTQVSPGTVNLPVPGPTDLGVRYDVIDPNARTLLASVSWDRRTARATTVGVIVDLRCGMDGAKGEGRL